MQYIKWSEKNLIIFIVEMKICISQTMVEFGPSEEENLLNGASLVKRGSVGNNSNNINQPSRFLPPDLATSRP